MKCGDCGEQISEKRKCGLCKICYHRDYRKRNKDKIRPVARAKYLRRREYFLRKIKEWNQKNGYASDKRPERKKDQLIRAKTRNKYPLKGETCLFCDKFAEHRHHTTKPIEIDKFMFLCEAHHCKIHGKQFAMVNLGEKK